MLIQEEAKSINYRLVNKIQKCTSKQNIKIPGGKPKTWNAIWSSCNYILSDFARKMDDINLPSEKPKSPSKKENGQTEPANKTAEPSNT